MPPMPLVMTDFKNNLAVELFQTRLHTVRLHNVCDGLKKDLILVIYHKVIRLAQVRYKSNFLIFFFETYKKSPTNLVGLFWLFNLFTIFIKKMVF